MFHINGRVNKNTRFILIALCWFALAYTTKAAISSNNSLRPTNNQYTSFQQQQQQQHQQQQQQQQSEISSASSASYFATNNQNPFLPNNQHQQPQYQPQSQQQQHQGAVTEKDVIDRFQHRYPDGSYEFRYELADGTARYERGYFLIYDKIKTLVVVGYYSYRQTNGNYITVFYNADQNGYRQNQSITPQVYPNLPRSIEVPQFKDNVDYATEGPNKLRA